MRRSLALLFLSMALTLASPAGASTAHPPQRPRTSAKAEPLATNPAPSRNRHQRRHTNSKKHTHRHKSGVKK
ncbi:MAG TPA: hypothetical protein VFI60_01350 [Candidatus Acidoferrum sp.]|nr:hypothetical protein [Candidatus Acidoferrum sp.]